MRFDSSLKLLSLTLIGLGLGACQAIAGIEDRKLDPNAAAAQANSKVCQDYCTTVMANCTGGNAVYTTQDLCLGVCALLDPGDPNEPTDVPNSIACRKHQADLARLEPADNCIAAGPGGNGVCGTDCDAYCQIYPKACKADYEYTTTDQCLQACSGLIEQPDRFDVIKDHEGDTIECRLVHTSSATVDPTTHCPHATIRPAQPWCTGKPTDPPTCEEYCKIELAACTDDLTQYESQQQCMDVCGAFQTAGDIGTNEDETGNTIGCRRYHSFNATLDATTHCSHSGPSGDGHCGDHGTVADGHTGNCESYCTLLAAACADEFQSTFGSADKCMSECVKLPEAAPDSGYTLAKAKTSSGLQCRILHAVEAFESKTACTSAIGGDVCNQ
jgi:hypothetical protein